MSLTYRVLVRRFDDSDEHVVAAGVTERHAEKLERATLRQINTEEWYVTTEREGEGS